MDLLIDRQDNLIFDVEKGGESLEGFLLNQDLSSRFFRRVYRNRSIYVNGKSERKSYQLKAGDRVVIVIEDEIDNTLAEDIPLDIIYEDMDLIAVNKPAFMVVHPTKSHQNKTISNGLAHYFQKQGIKRKIRLVNRLDMDTSGVLLVAKSSFAHQQMALQFQENTVEKRYIALVAGRVEKDQATIDLPIAREEERSIRKTVCPTGKESISRYRVVERFKEASLLDLELVTGRSHQLRVHLSHIGHPIIGDSLYFEPSPYIDRQALHAYYLRISQPRTKEGIELKADLPQDIEKLISHLK